MKKRKPLSVWLIVFLLFFLAGGGFMGGWGFLSDPSGSSMGFPPELIEQIPVIQDYWWPGLVLFTLFGLMPMIAAWGLIVYRRKDNWQKENITIKRHWAWHIGQWTGVILIGWIIAQMAIIGLQHPVQISTGILGLVLFLLVRKKSVRNYYSVYRITSNDRADQSSSKK